MNEDVLVLVNIAPGQVCSQSSSDPERLELSLASAAVDGTKRGEFSFQTASELDPWWEIRWPSLRRLEAVVLYNYDTISFDPRCTVSELRESARHIKLAILGSDRVWREVYDHERHGGGDYGGIRSGPLVAWTHDVATDALRIQLPGRHQLHLDGVEVYASAVRPRTDAAHALLEAANRHAFPIADRIFGALAASSHELAAWAKPEHHPLNAAGLHYLVRTLLGRDEVELAMALVAAWRGAGVHSSPVSELLFRRAVQAGDRARATEALEELTRNDPLYGRLPALRVEYTALAMAESTEPIKLIIWDLDETLWTGTLAEGDLVELIAERAQLVRDARERGIACSIVSNNDPATASAKLNELGLDDHFVFPQLAFEPKGPRVRAVIEALGLRDVNCLFIDDNETNLREALHFCPALRILNAHSPDADRALRGFIDAGKPDGGKRYRQYKLLEGRTAALKVFGGEADEFLRQSHLAIAMVGGARNVRFARRIEELVNRSNQLNFTTSRIPPGTATYLVGAPSSTIVGPCSSATSSGLTAWLGSQRSTATHAGSTTSFSRAASWE